MKITDKPPSVDLTVNAGQRKFEKDAVEVTKPGSPSVQLDIRGAGLGQTSDDIDEKLVSAIRSQLQSGDFELDYNAVADSILQNAIAFSRRSPAIPK